MLREMFGMFSQKHRRVMAEENGRITGEWANRL